MRKKYDFSKGGRRNPYLERLEPAKIAMALGAKNVMDAAMRIAQLMTALQFYAQPQNWKPIEVVRDYDKNGKPISWISSPSPVETDKGETARLALGWKEPKNAKKSRSR